MSRKPRQPVRHLIDGAEMTVQEIADMLGISKNALQVRKSELGGPSYQTVVDMYRENQFGIGRDRGARYLVEGRWMTRAQIAEMLGIQSKSLRNWLYKNKGKTVWDAIEWHRQYQTGERRRYRGTGGRPPVLYRAGHRVYTVPQVAKQFGVSHQSVMYVLKRRGGDMAATIRHYKEREQRRTRRAENDILAILMEGQA